MARECRAKNLAGEKVWGQGEAGPTQEMVSNSLRLTLWFREDLQRSRKAGKAFSVRWWKALKGPFRNLYSH